MLSMFNPLHSLIASNIPVKTTADVFLILRRILIAVIVILDLLEFTANVKVNQFKNNSSKTSSSGVLNIDRHNVF